MAILILFCIVGFMSWWFSNHFSDYGREAVYTAADADRIDREISEMYDEIPVPAWVTRFENESEETPLPITAEYPVVEDDPVEGTGAHTFTVDPIWANTVPESMKITDQYPWTQ